MVNQLKFKGILIVISSPSGAGKTSLANSIVEENENISFSTSVTTRPPRDGEKNGREYHFVEKDQFNLMIKNKRFIEYAEVFGNYYGTPKDQIEKLLNDGKDIIFDVDWQGGTKIRNSYLSPLVVSVFILPPSKEILFERLSNRDMKDKLIVEERMQQFERDVLHWINYDYVVINDDLEKCYLKIKNLINAEINDGSKDYDLDFIRNHVEKLTS